MRRTRRNEFVPTERNLERWQAVRELLPDGLRASAGDVIGETEGLSVVIVDGDVEGERNAPFWRGGHDLVYPSFIPRRTVWLDGAYDPKFLRFVLYHELVERELMALGVPYSLEEKGGRGAHEFALDAEPETDPIRRNSDENARRASRLALAEGSSEAITRALVEIARSGGADRVRMLAAFGYEPARIVFPGEVQVDLGDWVTGARHVESLDVRDITRWMLALVEQGADAVAKTPITDRLPRRAAWARSVLERAAMEATTWLRAAVESGEGVREVDYHRMGVDIELFGEDTPENAETLEPATMLLFYNACVTSAERGPYAAESAITAAAWGRHIPGVTRASQVELLARVVLSAV